MVQSHARRQHRLVRETGPNDVDGGGGSDIIHGEKWIANNWINILGESRDIMVSYKVPKKMIDLKKKTFVFFCGTNLPAF